MLLAMKIILILVVFTLGFIAGTITTKKLIESRNTKFENEKHYDNEIYGDIPNFLKQVQGD